MRIICSTIIAVSLILVTTNDSFAQFCPITFTQTDASCGGSDGTATAVPSVPCPTCTYQWDVAAGSQTTESVGGLSEGTYTVTVTDPGSGTACTGIVTIEEPSLTVTVQDACNGLGDGEATVTVIGNAPSYTYLWDDPSTQTTATANSLGAGTYIVTVTASSAETCTATATITELPPIVLNPSPDRVCINDDFLLIANPSGGAANYASFQWSTGATTYPAQTTDTLTVSPGIATNEIYTVVVTDTNGCQSNPENHTVFPNPAAGLDVMISPPGPLTKCLNGEAVLTATGIDGNSNGASGYSYNWSSGQPGEMDTVTSSTVSIETYVVTVTDGNGCVDSTDIDIDWQACTFVFGISPNKAVYCEGESVTLSVSGGTPGATYNWSMGSTLLATTLDTFLNTIVPLDTTTIPFSVEIVDGVPIGTDTINIIISAPEVSITSVVDTVCHGDTLNLVASCPSCPYTPLSYVWSPAGAGSMITPNVSPSSPATNTTYNVTLTDNVGCTGTASKGISVFERRTPNISPDNPTLCPGSTISLITASCTSCAYTWYNSPTLPIPTTTPLSGATSNSHDVNSATPPHYKVVVENTATGCKEADSTTVLDGNVGTINTIPNTILYLCEGAPDTIKVAPSVLAACAGCSYNWNVGGTTPELIVTTPGIYYVDVTNPGGCSGVSSPVVALISDADSASLVIQSNSLNLCSATDSVLLSVAACFQCDYAWYKMGGSPTLVSTNRQYAATSTGFYYVEVQNEDGCLFLSNTVEVVDLSGSLPTAPSINSSLDYVCAGAAPFIFDTLSVPLGAGYEHQWFYNGVAIGGETDSFHISNSSGTYYVDVTYPNGCVQRSDTVLIIDSLITPTVTTSGNRTVLCPSTSVSLTTPVQPGWFYQWYLSGTAIPGATNTSYSIDQPGDYYVVVQTENGCIGASASGGLPPIAIDASPITSLAISTNTTSICDQQTATLSAPLCVGCQYEWFRNGLSTSQTGTIHTTQTAGDYYVLITVGTAPDLCIVPSDTITIQTKPSPTATLAADNNVVCNGVSPTFTTNSCLGCTYVWMKDTLPILGAPNGATYTSNSAGSFQVEIIGANGCSDTSSTILIAEDSTLVNATLQLSTDGLVCNGENDTLVVQNCPSGCTYEWFRNGTLVASTSDSNYITNTTGNYNVRVVNVNGCRFQTNSQQISEVNLFPSLNVSPSLICGTGDATMVVDDGTVSACPTCDYEWYRVGNPVSLTGAIPLPSYTTSTVGAYYATLVLPSSTCRITSSSVVLNPAPALSTAIAATDTSICSDTSVILQYVGTCTSCVLQWMRDGNAIPSAILTNFTTTTGGIYQLEVKDTLSNCIDTSAGLTIHAIYPPAGMALDFSGSFFRPRPADPSSPINLDLGLSPPSLLGQGLYTSTPLNASLAANIGLVGRTFYPGDSTIGKHIISLSYDTMGCTFVVEDFLEVLDTVEIGITNTNPASVPYEACPGDTLQILIERLPYNAINVLLLDQQNIYRPVNIIANTLSPISYGPDVVYDGVLTIIIPDTAKSSFFKIAGSSDTMSSPFVLIHNENLSIAGLPSILCSNGDSLGILGVPSGGAFSAEYSDGNSASSILSMNTLVPTLIDPSRYDSFGIQDIKIVYEYNSQYSNSNACPSPDTIGQWVEARAVFLDSVEYMGVSMSETSTNIEDLVFRVWPYEASPGGLPYTIPYDISYSGSFTSPVGAPLTFLPKNAGMGVHPLTYQIENGGCTNSVTGDINVLSSPQGLNIPDTICRTASPLTFGRDPSSFIYGTKSIIIPVPTQTLPVVVVYQDTLNSMVVTSGNANEGIDTLSPFVGFENFTYNPSQINIGTNHDTIRIQYLYQRTVLSSGVPTNTFEYVIGSIVHPIYIEDVIPVQILTNVVDSVYCEENVIRPLAASPPGGQFSFQGGTAAYASEVLLANPAINPFDVHSPESTTTDYWLTYTLFGAACENKDSMQIKIPEPLNSDFWTQSGDSSYCASSPDDSILTNTIAPNVSTWFVGNVQQNAHTFSPSSLGAGTYIVRHDATDLYGCSTSKLDTFVVYGLPELAITPPFQPTYCSNDSAIQFVLSPPPTSSAGTGLLTGPAMTYLADSSYLFSPNMLPSGNIRISYSYTDSLGCTDSLVYNSTIQQHSAISFTNLDSIYCSNHPDEQLAGMPVGGYFQGEGINLDTTPTLTPVVYSFDSSGTEIITYSYTDQTTGCVSEVSDTVVVLPINHTVEMSNLALGYCQDADSIILDIVVTSGNPFPGYFAGAGVVNGSLGPGLASFHPDSAVNIMGHTGDVSISYVFSVPNGCVDTLYDTTRVHALPKLSFVNLPSHICSNASPVFVQTNNHLITGALGEIHADSLLPVGASGLPANTIITNSDMLTPSLGTVGWWPIVASYIDGNGCEASITDSVRIDSVPELYFTGLPSDRIFCENSPVVLMLAFPQYYPGSGELMVTDSNSTETLYQSFYSIVPDSLLTQDSLFYLDYSYKDGNGCIDSLHDSIIIRPYPRIDFAGLSDKYCYDDTVTNLMPFVSPQGGIFLDVSGLAPSTSIIQDSIFDPVAILGNRKIRYSYQDSTGCSNKKDTIIKVYRRPELTMDVEGAGCEGSNITFKANAKNLDGLQDTLSKVDWNFGGTIVPQTPLPNPDRPINIEDQLYNFGEGIYTVTLAVENHGYCADTISQQVVISPLVSSYPYLEDFEMEHGGWYPENDLVNGVPLDTSLWQYGEATGMNLNTAGNQVWAIVGDTTWDMGGNLVQKYKANERGWLYSPCFDFTAAKRPMIAMNIWRDMNAGIDGTVMEYYDENSNDWQLLGEPERGIHWYPDGLVLSRPGNQWNNPVPTGWTGQSSGWNKARYRLDRFVGEQNTRFRMAFASANTPNISGFEGMALDSVWIGERTRNVLVEHFSNRSYSNIEWIDQHLYNTIFNSGAGRDVILIQHQTNLSSPDDPLNMDNTSDPAARVLYYGVAGDNRALVDGAPIGTGKSSELTPNDFEYDMLQFPIFEIDVDPIDISTPNEVGVSYTVRALTTVDPTPYIVVAAVIEDSLPITANHASHVDYLGKRILRKFLPDAGGEYLTFGWVPNQFFQYSENWEKGDGGTFVDPTKLEVVVYIQNLLTQEIVQAQTTRDLSLFTPIVIQQMGEDNAKNVISAKLYPNPTKKMFKIEFDAPLSHSGTWTLVDALGRTVRNGQVSEGTKLFSVSELELSGGSYFFVLRIAGGYIQKQVTILD